MSVFPLLAQAAPEAPPAGGAAIDEVVIATAGALLVTSALLVLGLGHRSGRVGILGRVAALAERQSGMPGWTALPLLIATVSLLVALVGMYWDIALHIDVGRDTGPLANPAHYLILAGLFGIFSAGFIAIALPRERPSTTAIRITRDWYAPLGGVLICACGAFSLLGFPLDDVWHRLFGQDVTLWGPTHLMLIGGAAMTLIGIAVLHVEGSRAPGHGRHIERSWIRWARMVALTGGLLIGLSTFQAEFDFGVPQFRLVFHPLLTMLAAGTALVAARLWLGRGAAVGAVAFFLVVRGLLALLVGPVLGQTAPHFPLYLAAAVAVELVALRVPRERPVAFGAWCGLAIATVGLAAEWAWSLLWMPIPWTAALLHEGALFGFAGAVCGALLGAWIGARLGADVVPRGRPLRRAAVAASVGVALLVLGALYAPADEGVTARLALERASDGGQRAVSATVELQPSGAADDAEWLTVTAWQGEGLVVNHLEEVAPGVHRTTEPIPVGGNWKSMVRLHHGSSLTAAPIDFPADPAIPAAAIPAVARDERALIADRELLQREQQPAHPAVTAAAYSVVIAVALTLLCLLAWGLHRLAVAARRQWPASGWRPALGSVPAANREDPADRRADEQRERDDHDQRRVPRADDPVDLNVVEVQHREQDGEGTERERHGEPRPLSSGASG